MNNLILEKYPPNKRLFKSEDSTYESWAKNSCIFGMAHYNDPLPSIDEMPRQTTSLYTYFGEGNFEILESLLQNGLNENLEQLIIGFEHSNAKYGYKDYSKISELLSSVSFPKLKQFDYGDDFLLVNENQYYPHLGDLTDVFKNMPYVENISLNGSFELQNSISLKNVTEFFLIDYWTEISNGITSKKTIDFLLESDFQNLNDFQISLKTENNITYCFNEKTLTNNLDKLKCVAIDGKFETGTKDRLLQILKPTVAKLHLDGIKE